MLRIERTTVTEPKLKCTCCQRQADWRIWGCDGKGKRGDEIHLCGWHWTRAKEAIALLQDPNNRQVTAVEHEE